MLPEEKKLIAAEAVSRADLFHQLLGSHGPATASLEFALRVLDITKPPPARRAEKFHGGLGIMADDLIVGIYGNLILRAGLYFIGRT